MRRLTRTQIRFLDEFMKFKVRAQKGKGKNGPGGLSMSGTPEQIYERMYPKFKKRQDEGRKAEIAAAKRAQNAWEKKHEKNRPKQKGR